MRAALQEVVAHGAPAQAAQARRLLDLLAEDPDDPAAVEAANALVDAYFNDPYLTRNPTSSA
jgi:hypothetical protein